MKSTTRVTARDLMRSDLTTLAPHDTIATALELFEELGISGAPVVANERLVGMLTLTDVARPEHQRGGRIETESEFELSEPVGEELTDEYDPAEVFFLKEGYSPPAGGRELVAEWMSEGVVSVPADASLQQVCEAMVQNGMHRVCVTENGRVVGLITTFDVVRHVAQREARPKGGARRHVPAKRGARRRS